MMRLRSLLFGLFIAVILSISSAPAPAAAIDVFPDCASSGKTTDYCKEVVGQKAGTNPVIHIIKIVIDIVSFIGGAAAVIGLIVSGLRMILANGDSSAIATARSSVIYSLIGIAVIVLAQGIVVFVLDKVK